MQSKDELFGTMVYVDIPDMTSALNCLAGFFRIYVMHISI